MASYSGGLLGRNFAAMQACVVLEEGSNLRKGSCRASLLPSFLRPRKVHTKGDTQLVDRGGFKAPLCTSAGKRRMMMARRMLLRGSQPLSLQSLVRSVAATANPVVVRNASTTLPVTKFPFWQPITQSSQPTLLRSNNRHVWKASAGFASAAAVNPDDVLRFWFKDADLATNKFPMQFWFFGGEAADNEIKEKFGECLERASRGEYDHWKSTPRGRVALVLVLDQFSRNCHRDSSRSFAQDEAALQITLDSIHQGIDQQVSNPLERYFLYMPLMHSESSQVHEEANRVFQKLVDDHKDAPELHELFLGILKFEKAHSAVLNKFGRYPSRNKVLGRTSTPEEEAYLARGELWPMEE